MCRDGLVKSLMASGQSVAAAQAMSRWLAPDDLDGLMRAAALLSEGGRPEEALDIVRRVLSVSSDSPNALVLEALLLADLGRYAEAEPALKKILRKDRENVDALLALAWSITAAGRAVGWWPPSTTGVPTGAA